MKQLANRPTSQPTDQLTNQPTNSPKKPINQPTNQPTNLPNNQRTKHPINMSQPRPKPSASATNSTLSSARLYFQCRKSFNLFNLLSLLLITYLTSTSSAAPSGPPASRQAHSRSSRSASAATPHPRRVASDLTASPSDSSFIDPGSSWQRPVFCPNNTFVGGFKSWQDDTYGDHKGLTQIVFSCDVNDPEQPQRRHHR